MADQVAGPCLLCVVGVVFKDVVSTCLHYPVEDQENRAVRQHWRIGGNAANSSTVLSLIGREAELLATLGAGSDADFVVGYMDRLGVSYDHCVVYPSCRHPTSNIVINSSNGSRTMVYYSDLPELKFEDFSKLNLSHYSWVHFEGRNIDEVERMIAHIRQFNATMATPSITISVELEQPEPEVIKLLPLADVVFMSKDFAGYHGYDSPETACQEMKKKARERAIVVCAWGEKGAAVADANGQLHSSTAFSPEKLVDTLGAGDTFNAAMIHKLSQGEGARESVVFACRVAGAKCGMEGYEDLKKLPWLRE